MNALDTALVRLAAASTALEHTARPGLKDVEEAKKQAKAAAEILDSAHKLMSYGVYTVADAPAEPGVPLFDPQGGPAIPPALVAEESPEVVDVLTPTPVDFLRSWDAWTPEEQQEHFNLQLTELSRLHQQISGEVEPLDITPWLNRWTSEERLGSEGARRDAFEMVLFCLEHEEFDLPNPSHVTAWVQGLLHPTLPEELILWDSWDEAEQVDEFQRQLDNLAEKLDAPSGLIQPWEEAFEADWKDTFTRLLIAHGRLPLSLEIPSDEERDAWLAARTPADEPQPEEDLQEKFENLLEKLKESGRKESGLKLKAWAAAEKAWRESLSAYCAWTVEALEWRLNQSEIVWEVPTPEEIGGEA